MKKRSSTITKTAPKPAPRTSSRKAEPAPREWTLPDVLTIAHAAGLPSAKLAEFSLLPEPEGAADHKWLLNRVVGEIREAGRVEGHKEGREEATRETFYKSGEYAWDAAHERTVGDLVAGAFAADLMTRNVSSGLLDLVQMLLNVLSIAEMVDGGLDPKLSSLVRHRIQTLAEHGRELAYRVDSTRKAVAS